MSARAHAASRVSRSSASLASQRRPLSFFNVIIHCVRARATRARLCFHLAPPPRRPSVQTHPWGISRVTDRSFVMKYTITKDAEAEIQYEGKEGIAGEKPRTVVEVRPSIRPFAVASHERERDAHDER